MSAYTPEQLFFGYTNDNKDLLKELITYNTPEEYIDKTSSDIQRSDFSPRF